MDYFTGRYLRKLYPKAYFTLPLEYRGKLRQFVFYKAPGRNGLIMRFRDRPVMAYSPAKNAWVRVTG